MFRSYRELKERVRGGDMIEQDRMAREYRLFEQRGWRRYIVFLANAMPEIPEGISQHRSALDSYVLFKAVDQDRWDPHFLLNQNNEEVLMNDALRLNLELFSPERSEIKNWLETIDHIFTREVKRMRLSVFEQLIPHPEDCGNRTAEQFYVVSKRPLTDEEKTVIVNEVRDSTEEENEILRSVLIIRILTHIGL